MVSREKRRYSILLFVITTMVALAILSRIFWLTLLSEPQERTYRDPEISPRVVRGSITDRNGRLFAIETPYYSCALLLREVEDLGAVAAMLGPLLSMAPQDIIRNAAGNTTYHLVKRRLTVEEHGQVAKLISEQRPKGVLLEKRHGRSYPQHYHGAQLIGFTNTENRGIEGLELAYDHLLSPYPGLGPQITYGHDVALTIDVELQYLLDTQVIAIDREHMGDSVVGIIMGAKSGEILAATTFPWYDPNLYQESETAQRQNRLITAMFEPGSSFKVFSLAAELAAGQADFSEPFFCDGSYEFTMPNGNRATINCVSAHGTVDPRGMLKFSCNGAVAHWALQTDDQAFHATLQAFGFGSTWETGLPGGIAGRLVAPDSWSGRTKATISFGQELGVTALQMAAAATAFATGGDVMQPHIIKEIKRHDGTSVEKSGARVARSDVISPEVARIVLEGMEMATTSGGTATKAAVDGVRVAAKTGTAQMADPSTGSYRSDAFLASTLALVPADDPEYIIYIGVENPTGATIWGSNIAAPAIGSIIADMVRQGKIRSSAMETVTLP